MPRMTRRCRSTASICAAPPTRRSDRNRSAYDQRDSRDDHRAAADTDNLAGDVRRHIAREKQREIRDLARFAETAHGIAPLRTFEHSLGINPLQEFIVNY